MSKKENNTNYSIFERTCARLLSKFPHLKSILKLTYQRLNYILHRPQKSFYSDFEINIIEDGDKETFFGYYDKSPINLSNKYMIFQSSSLSTSLLPSCKEPVEITLYDIELDRVIAHFKSYTYNWQQGSKLQWINEEEFIFNSIDSNNKYCSYIINVKNLEPQKIDSPVYDITANKIIYTLNFDRLAVLRPDYGYLNHLPYSLSEDLNSDGIYKYDIENKSNELIISFKQLLEQCPIYNDSKGIVHKINHIICSPSGKAFIFLHRYFIRGIKYDRLMHCDKDGNNLKVLASDDMVSHCCWLDDNAIIAYLRKKKIGDRYYQINVENECIIEVGEGIIPTLGDGHPTLYKGQMIFDTYPDKSRMKSLFHFNLNTQELRLLGKFLEPLKYHDQTRCDLHPRWSYDGKKVFFDSVHNGKRRLYYINIE